MGSETWDIFQPQFSLCDMPVFTENFCPRNMLHKIHAGGMNKIKTYKIRVQK